MNQQRSASGDRGAEQSAKRAANAAPGKQTLVGDGGDVAVHRMDDLGGGGGGACLDPEAVRADLQRIEERVGGVRLLLAGASLVGLISIDDVPELLRELNTEVETLRPSVEHCAIPAVAAELQQQLHDVQDGLLQCFQQLTVLHADRTLQAWSNAGDDEKGDAARDAQRNNWRKEASLGVGKGVDWCGTFAGAQLRAAGLAPEHHMAFNETTNVKDFFSYTDTTKNGRILLQIRRFGAAPPAGAEEKQVPAYHGERGSLRDWKRGNEVGDDIRAGDIVTVDWEDDGDANHIMVVASYVPGVLTTIDGNAFGAKKPGVAPAKFDGTDAMSTYSADNANERGVSTSRWKTDPAKAPNAELGPTWDRSEMLPANSSGKKDLTIYGRGRPSIVDFEVGHVYPDKRADITPPAADASTNRETNPLQRKETGEGAVIGDPASSFAAATGGGGGEIPYRAEMEARFAADFSSVQSFAGRDLSALSAKAATRGEQVAFTDSAPDRQTVAHELTHVLQARQGGGTRGRGLSDPSDASEREARQVESQLASGEQLSVGAATGGEVQRQEVPSGDAKIPEPIAPDKAEGSSRGLRVDWESYKGIINDSQLPSGGSPGSVREVYEFYLLQHLQKELPVPVLLYQVTYGRLPSEELPSLEGRAVRHQAVEQLSPFLARYQSALRTRDADAAEAMRLAMFRANEYAVVDALRVEGASRYQADPAEGDTFCNVYAFDVVTAMGGYLPRIWYKTEGGDFIRPGEEYSAELTGQVRANDLYDWMVTWGVPYFGWESLPTAQAAQTEANGGRIVVILGRTVEDDKDAAPGTYAAAEVGAGHVTVVMAESKALGRTRVPESEAGGQFLPLQSQAGAVNFASNGAGATADMGQTGRKEWWAKPWFTADEAKKDAKGNTANHGFFVYRGGAGQGDHSVRTPEQMGLVGSG